MSNYALQNGTYLHSPEHLYKIEKFLGQGSFGITYLATTTQLTKVKIEGSLGGFEQEVEATVKVTIKEFFMKSINSREYDGSTVGGMGGEMTQDYRRKFRKEAINLSHLKHPNIVQVREVFDANNTTYYAMQFINGQSLNDYIEERGCLAEEEAIGIIKQVAKPLQYMHEKKMLHLDLKPGNIMLDSSNNAYLIDFGLSKQYTEGGEPETSTTIGLGTPGYAPLEQANYRQDGSFPATLDMYALGATLYKMLVGVTPPPASEVLRYGLPTDTLMNRGTTKATFEAIKKAMNPKKDERFQSVSDFLHCLPSELKENDVDMNISIFLFYYDQKRRGLIPKIYHHMKVYQGEYTVDDFINREGRLEQGLTWDNFMDLFSIERENVGLESFVQDTCEIAYIHPIICYDGDFSNYFHCLNIGKRYKRPKRIMRASHLVALAIPNLYGSVKTDILCKVKYNDDEYVLGCRQGVYDIHNSEDFEIPVSGVIVISDADQLKCLVLGFYKSELKGQILLNMLPFKIMMEHNNDVILECEGITLPFKQSVLLDVENSDQLVFFVHNRPFKIGIRNIFGYKPGSVMIVIEADANGDINFLLKDIWQGNNIVTASLLNMQYHGDEAFVKITGFSIPNDETLFEEGQLYKQRAQSMPSNTEIINGLLVRWNTRNDLSKSTIKYLIKGMKRYDSGFLITGTALAINSADNIEGLAVTAATNDAARLRYYDIERAIYFMNTFTGLPFRLPTPHELIRHLKQGESGIAYEKGEFYFQESGSATAVPIPVSELMMQAYHCYLVCDADPILIINNNGAYLTNQNNIEAASVRRRFEEVEYAGYGFYRVKYEGKWNFIYAKDNVYYPTMLLPEPYDFLSDIHILTVPGGGPLPFICLGATCKKGNLTGYLRVDGNTLKPVSGLHDDSYWESAKFFT